MSFWNVRSIRRVGGKPGRAGGNWRAAMAALFVAVGVGRGGLQAGYRIEDVAYPDQIRTGISAVAFTPAGSLVIATRIGEVWMRDGSGAWRLFARGFDEPLGLVAEAEDIIYVAHRPEVLRAWDSDRDGRADTFGVLGGQWGLTQNYHDFFYGLKRDAAGNFYGALSLQSRGGGTPEQMAVYPTLPVRGPRNLDHLFPPVGHRSEALWRGWVVRIRPDGKTEPIASGFRQANGIGLSPEGELFVTDNQGDYKAATGLIHVEPGEFHGHVASLKWEPGYDPGQITMESLWRRLKTPAVVFPHGPLGVSPGEPVWDLSGGKFGPYVGQVFVGDYSRFVARASLEKVAGAWQGAAFPFLGRNDQAPYATGKRLKSGATRGVFAPDGSLYLAATSGQGAGEDGLQRVVWDGEVAPEILDLKLTAQGLALSFTRAMEGASLRQPEKYKVTRFRYYYHEKYGSPWIDEERVEVRAVRATADGLRAELDLAGLRPGFIYEVSVPQLRTAAGEPLAHPLGYYTAKRLHDGSTTVGGTTRLPHPGETSQTARQTSTDPVVVRAEGERLYRFYCVACHQPDGRGVAGGAANFVDDPARLAKDDAQLLAVIGDGNATQTMPAFGAILNDYQRKAVLTYIRSAFGRGN